MRLMYRLAIVLVTTLCTVAALAIWFLITGHFDATGIRVLGSTLVVALCTVAALVGATVLDRPDARRALGAVTLILAAAEAALALGAIWSLLSITPLWLRAIGATGALAIGCAHASGMLGRLRRSDGNIVRRLSEASVAFAMLGALLVAGGFVFVARDVDADFWRVLGVLAVLSTLATLLAPIVRRLGHRLPSMHIG